MKSNVEKKSMNSDECSFPGWMLELPRTTSGVPLSGEQLRRASISTKKSRRGPGDHHNVELERKGDRDSMEFKCRSE